MITRLIAVNVYLRSMMGLILINYQPAGAGQLLPVFMNCHERGGIQWSAQQE